MVDSLRALAPKAVRVLADALEGEESVSAAIHVLKVLGFPGTAMAPTGVTDARIAAAQLEEAEDTAQHASEEVATAAKRRAHFRAMDNIQYNREWP